MNIILYNCVNGLSMTVSLLQSNVKYFVSHLHFLLENNFKLGFLDSHAV